MASSQAYRDWHERERSVARTLFPFIIVLRYRLARLHSVESVSGPFPSKYTLRSTATMGTRSFVTAWGLRPCVSQQ